MTAAEARKITDKKQEEIRAKNIFLAESFRESADEKILAAAENGESGCILGMNPKVDPEIKNLALALFQKDGFAACVTGNGISVRW